MAFSLLNSASRACAVALFALGVAFGSASTAAAEETVQAGMLEISGSWIRATPPTAKTSAGYLTIVNTGEATDRLIGLRVDFAKDAELHDMSMKDGIMSMFEMEEGVEIPAGEAVTFEPGGKHLMFMGLAEPMVEGEARPVTLIFERAGEVDLTLPVLRRAADEAGHGAHGGHGGHGQMKSE